MNHDRHNTTQTNTIASNDHNITPQSPKHTNNKKILKRNRTYHDDTSNNTTELRGLQITFVTSLTNLLLLVTFYFSQIPQRYFEKKMFQYYFQVKIDIKSTFLITDLKVSEFPDIRLDALVSTVQKLYDST